MPLLAIAMLTTGCAVQKSMQRPVALNLFEVFPDSTEKKVLRGVISKETITQDTTFSWYAENSRYFKPNAEAVSAITAKTSQLQLLMFLGTWCHDSQQLLPKYLMTLEAAGFPDNQLTLIAVDRNKTTVAGLHKVFNLVSVPTLIVMKGGKEVGRIVEYGSTALVDKELGELVAAMQE